MHRSSSELDAALERIVKGATADECESETLDFKEDRGDPREIERLVAEAVICFANASGGSVVVGVANNVRGPAAIRGTRIDPDHLRRRIYELTVPSLTVDVRQHHTQRQLLVVFVPPSPDIHADTQGRAKKRVHKDCLILSPEQLIRLREERRGINDWSAAASRRTIADVEPEAIIRARAILGAFNDERRALATLSNVDLLNALGVLLDRSVLNNAGAFLFCAAEPSDPPAVLYQYRTTPGGEPKAVVRIVPPLVIGFARVLELVVARQVLTPVTLPSGQQITIEDFPSLAVREAISNALCHRDHRLDGTVLVDHAPQVLSIDSPGPLVSGVTPSNILTTTPRPRNPALARAARTLGLAEELGRGIDRIYREMIRSGRAVPRIESDFDRVRVTLVGGAPNTQIARFVATLPEHEREDVDTMLIILHLCGTRTVNSASAAPILQKSVEEADAILRRLASEEAGLLESTAATANRRAAVYRFRSEALRGLGSAVAYQRRSTDELDRKVIAHLREYGQITNRTLQNFFDIDVYKARDIIGDLAQRGLLVRVSEQSRGSKVVWGPGPKFPTRAPRKRPTS